MGPYILQVYKKFLLVSSKSVKILQVFPSKSHRPPILTYLFPILAVAQSCRCWFLPGENVVESVDSLIPFVSTTFDVFLFIGEESRSPI